MIALLVQKEGRRTVAIRLLASHQGDPGSIPGRITPDFRMWDPCRTMPLVGGFSRRFPVFPALSFQRCSVLTLITIIGSQYFDAESRLNPFTHSPQKALKSAHFTMNSLYTEKHWAAHMRSRPHSSSQQRLASSSARTNR
ncbi:hypothetical protein PR048_024891 [Dryococelus australis]|uniref:Uncharacterized protein n=1 Tax=Dryococelus australis TaxID=614101 RepID=A0ABQ9GPT0_9NEOP|nr:hypothetical protein PR048_024891 [Dryococelus australis]